ncbi:sterol desaturase family protein [Parasulfitobacter algicola]|uniref:Sterol desaturase family protein n=1 Tax=Parasulfitobacter algicola TaxID=2614809 RepID=A0ABX2IP84_9RHOB|nr:sterol desaturase family protein [Sulfitobacter algicola]NSX54360.1 sterol desaturase family protein [Sulfitobacter algicola]
MQRIALMLSHKSIIAMMLALGAGLIFLGMTAPWWVWMLVPLGVGMQMINEYALHRFIFHLPPPRRQWAFDLLYQAHYGHHDFPTNKGLFFVPIWIALPVLALNLSFVYIALATAGLPLPLQIAVATVVVGGVLTFLGYEWFHMTAHLTVPKTQIERHVTTLHNQHHFRDFGRWFHVSPGGEIIDRAFGTAIDRDALKTQQRIEFIRTLGLSPDDPRLVSARRKFAAKYALRQDEIDRSATV